MATIEQSRFPYLWEVDVPAGADGWEQMYPYYLLSGEETRAHEQQLFWFQDSMHHPHPYFPFDTITFEAWGMSCGAYSTRVFALPPSRGLDLRLVNGYLYIGAVPVTDPQEIEARAVEFMKRAGHYYANWDDLFAKWRVKAEAAIHQMEAIALPSLPELEDEAVVTEGRGRSSAHDLISGYTHLVDLFFLVWQYHFEMLNIGYGAYVTFFQFCKQAFPSISDQEIARMVAGIDVLTFRPDEELKGLARTAVELGLAERIARSADDPDALLTELRADEAGRQWVEAFEAAEYPWFNFSSDYGFYHDQRSWIDDLSLPVSGIRGYIRRLQNGEDISRPTEALRRERDELAEEYAGFLDGENRRQFDELLGLSRTVFPFIEDHNFYVEHWMHTVFWNKMREIGALLVERGQFDDSDDVFFLNRHELAQLLYDVADAWAVGVPLRRPAGWRKTVAERKETLEALRQWPAPPALGAPPETVTDPFAIMNYGITSERVREWLGGGPADGAALTGIAGSPGVVEGPARVIRSEKELGDVQDGEILVCPITAPSWGPVFSSIGGVVTDIGGMMCHAAIVCREYGVPAVVGTGFATQTIATGQRVRVDGDRGEIAIVG